MDDRAVEYGAAGQEGGLFFLWAVIAMIMLASSSDLFFVLSKRTKTIWRILSIIWVLPVVVRIWCAIAFS